MDDLLREMDRDGSGSVDFEEFRAAMLQEAPKSADSRAPSAVAWVVRLQGDAAASARAALDGRGANQFPRPSLPQGRSNVTSSASI